MVSALLIPLTVYASAVDTETRKKWLAESYQHGNAGRDCSDILYNYGLGSWTVSSEDPEMLKRLFGACTTGKEDRTSGRDRLPEMLKSLHNGE